MKSSKASHQQPSRGSRSVELGADGRLRLTPAQEAELAARAGDELGELTPLEDVIAEVEQIGRGEAVVHVAPAAAAK